MHLQIEMACKKYQLCIRDIKPQNTIGICFVRHMSRICRALIRGVP